MSRLRFVRYGIASALITAAASMSTSCVSGGVDSAPGGDVGTGAQGTAATGNYAGTSVGNQPGQGGSGNGVAGGPTGGTSSAQGGSVSTGGMQGKAGMTSTGGGGVGAGGSNVGGSTSSAGAGAGGKGAAGSTGQAGAMGQAGSTGGPQPLPRITGSSGFATRYWDCCKPACNSANLSCSSNSSNHDNGGSACQGGSAYMCYSFEPFVDPANKYVAYAFAASHRNCGSCWEIQFTGSAGCSEGSACPGNATSLLYNTLYVQVINTGDIKDDQFDLLIPGGGVGQFNACSNEWGTSDLGATYGGFLTACNGSVSCTQDKCNTVFKDKPDLLAGCNWFLGWYAGTDNPQITFTQVSCPSQLTSKSGISG